MAMGKELSEEELRAVATQLAPTLQVVFGTAPARTASSRRQRSTRSPAADAAVGPAPPPVTVEVGETLEVWQVRELVTDPGIDLIARAGFAQRHHHQVFVENAPAGFALSKPGETPGAWDVTRVAASPFARDLDQAIEAIDREVPEPVPVRLLKLTAYLTSLLWIVDPPNDRFYVVSCPGSFRHLKRGEWLSREALARAIAAEQAAGTLQAAREDRAGPDAAPE